MFFQLFEADQ